MNSVADNSKSKTRWGNVLKIIVMALFLFILFMTAYMVWSQTIINVRVVPASVIRQESTKYWRDPVTKQCYTEKWGKLMWTPCQTIPESLVEDWNDRNPKGD